MATIVREDTLPGRTGDRTGIRHRRTIRTYGRIHLGPSTKGEGGLSRNARPADFGGVFIHRIPPSARSARHQRSGVDSSCLVGGHAGNHHTPRPASAAADGHHRSPWVRPSRTGADGAAMRSIQAGAYCSGRAVLMWLWPPPCSHCRRQLRTDDAPGTPNVPIGEDVRGDELARRSTKLAQQASGLIRRRRHHLPHSEVRRFD